MLAKKALTAEGIERGEHAGLKELLGWNAWTAQLLVEFVEERRKLLEDGVGVTLDGAQRMVGGHTVVEIEDRQKVRLGLRFSTHGSLTRYAKPCSIKPKKRFSPTC